MERLLILSIVALLLSSCANNREDRSNVNVNLLGERVEICSDAPIFEVVYADDTVVVASLLSNVNLLGAYRIGEPESYREFLKVGRGPMEVVSATIFASSDTLHIMSHGPFGLSDVLRIPVASISDMGKWEYTDCSEVSGLYVGNGFCMKSKDEYIVLGERFGQENIMSVLSLKDRSVSPVAFWPDDGFDGPAMTKQMMYMPASKVFCKGGSKVLYACSEGRYVSVLDIGSSAVLSESMIYDEYPLYRAGSDGLNCKRSSRSHIGVMSFATDSFIYVSPLECQLVDGEYVPDNYKGYQPYFNDKIEVYDWDCNYVRTYCLDIPFGTFYVSDDDSFIYTVTENKETLFSEIYRYDLSGFVGSRNLSGKLYVQVCP